MKCKYCGAEVPNDAQFCPNCGKDLSKVRKCVKCGEIIDDDATFCPHCGAKNPIYDEGSHSRKWVWAVVAIVIFAALGGGVWYYTTNMGGPSSQGSSSRDSLVSDTSAAQGEASQQLSYDDKQNSKYIEQRVTNIYGQVKDGLKSTGENFYTSGSEGLNDKFLTAEYGSLYKRVLNAEANGDLILDINHWLMSQDGNPIDFKVLNANIEDDNTALVSVKYIFSDRETITVRLIMKFERGDWYIDDFQCSKVGVNSEKETCYNSGV